MFKFEVIDFFVFLIESDSNAFQSPVYSLPTKRTFAS